jgi:hypothetical protein
MKYILPFLLITCFTATAQKLPNVQAASLRAPANIKIDGKATEWNNQFQAYNKATGVYYTIANDDDKLYLAVQANDPEIIRKIVLGGLTLTIDTSGKKNDKTGVAITFPAYDNKNPPVSLILNNKPKVTADTVTYRMRTDSFIYAHNQQLTDKLILIKVEGIRSIEDNILSIYNAEGIKAISLFDKKMNYTCELAIPLKYTGLNKQRKFNYNVKINGPRGNGSNVQVVNTSRGDMIIYTGSDGVNYGIGLATSQNLALAYPTDFWGEYTLQSSYEEAKQLITN